MLASQVVGTSKFLCPILILFIIFLLRKIIS